MCGGVKTQNGKRLRGVVSSHPLVGLEIVNEEVAVVEFRRPRLFLETKRLMRGFSECGREVKSTSMANGLLFRRSLDGDAGCWWSQGEQSHSERPINIV